MGNQEIKTQHTQQRTPGNRRATKKKKQAHNLDAHYHEMDDAWYSPLSSIFWQDKKLAIALIPYFKKRGYQIGKEKEYSKEFLNAWEKN